MSYYDNLCRNLAFLRKCAGLTQGETAAVFEIKRSTYASYEEGRATPSIDLIVKFCKLYEITFEDLVSEKETLIEFVWTLKKLKKK